MDRLVFRIAPGFFVKRTTTMRRRLVTGGALTLLVVGLAVVAVPSQTVAAPLVSSGPVWVGTTASSAAVVTSASSTTSSTKPPHTDIVKNSSDVGTYDPDALSAKWSGPTTEDCETSLMAVIITNTTSEGHNILYKGKVIGYDAPDSKGGLCFWGSGRHLFKFGLSSSTSKLAVTVT